jgi:acyl-CoA dehydrogenase
MDFTQSDRTIDLQHKLTTFLEEEIYPAEETFLDQTRTGAPHVQPPVLEELKAKARALGLWNLFLPHKTPWNEPISNVEYAPLAELTGRSFWLAPEALNCSSPDTGNMELLAMFGTEQQQVDWLKPLLGGEIRSSYVMTEPDVASSDAGNIATTITRDGDEYVINGHKWWITGAARDRCKLLLLLGVSDPDAERHRRHSVVLIPKDARGVEIVRDLHVLSENPWESHVEMRFDNVRVPVTNLLGEQGAGFAMAQARLGPGRIHHCMRQIGAAERALELMVTRAESRATFGTPLVDQGVIREWIALSRMEIDQARLYTLYTAWLMDTVGNKAAASEISGIKIAVPRMATGVIDRAIQVFGGAGLSQDTPLAAMYSYARVTRIADGPDEVHLRGLARTEIRRQREARAVAAGRLCQAMRSRRPLTCGTHWGIGQAPTSSAKRVSPASIPCPGTRG